MQEKKLKKYWRSPEEQNGSLSRIHDIGHEDELPQWEKIAQSHITRRSFLKAAGFFFGAGALSSCSRSPATKAIPYLVAPEEIIPGKSFWYASTCGSCNAACGSLVKVRDGRPIKMEGNPAHQISNGGLCAVGQASVLELYDSKRLLNPMLRGESSTWEKADLRVKAALREAQESGRGIRVLSSTVHSPSLKRVIGMFLERHDRAQHVVYDALSLSAINEAHRRTHGQRMLPRYRFDRADVIVAIDADFLGTWISPVEFSAAWRQGRVPQGEIPRMSYHAQFESRMSLTGANADDRGVIAPGQEALLAAHLANHIAHRAGSPEMFHQLPSCPIEGSRLEEISQRLWQARGKSLVVCGTNRLSAQLAVNVINGYLGSYGATIDIERPSLQGQGNDADLSDLWQEINQGKVGVLIVHGCNPAAELPAPGESWASVLKNVNLVISTSPYLDETSRLAQVIAPDPHSLESWMDHEPVVGNYSLTQPVIEPLRQTRSVLESFSIWGRQYQSSMEIVRETWRGLHHLIEPSQSFEQFWTNSVHDGFRQSSRRALSVSRIDYSAAGSVKNEFRSHDSKELSLLLYPKVAILDGRHAQNPWLQEMPDPVTKVVWDNYASISPVLAKNLDLKQGDIVRLSASGKSLELPVFIQPGQSDLAVAVALGYGREGTQRFFDVGPDWISGKNTVAKGLTVGQNASQYLFFENGQISYAMGSIKLEKTGRFFPLACTQDYHTLKIPEKLAHHEGEVREIVKETTLHEYASAHSSQHSQEHHEASLWPVAKKEGKQRWGMSIDLSLCTGCSACVVACQAENNVAVAGKDEVGRRRDMAWLRIDRYYSENSDSLETLHQPMMCQQCGHAPCETVCPVVATAGSEDGLNQQIYNRCVGTRYCANNCPYKVRRFNWFEYRRPNAQENLVLNPDVTIRSRGVMEKCSFCVQRIQEARIAAKARGEELQDGDIRPACQQSCPTKAIVFGDLNNKESQAAMNMQGPRRYRVLEELGVEPAVGYLMKVRNRQS